jgi:hypothetical protein
MFIISLKKFLIHKTKNVEKNSIIIDSLKINNLLQGRNYIKYKDSWGILFYQDGKLNGNVLRCTCNEMIWLEYNNDLEVSKVVLSIKIKNLW